MLKRIKTLLPAVHVFTENDEAARRSVLHETVSEVSLRLCQLNEPICILERYGTQEPIGAYAQLDLLYHIDHNIDLYAMVAVLHPELSRGLDRFRIIEPVEYDSPALHIRVQKFRINFSEERDQPGRDE